MYKNRLQSTHAGIQLRSLKTYLSKRLPSGGRAGSATKLRLNCRHFARSMRSAVLRVKHFYEESCAKSNHIARPTGAPAKGAKCKSLASSGLAQPLPNTSVQNPLNRVDYRVLHFRTMVQRVELVGRAAARPHHRMLVEVDSRSASMQLACRVEVRILAHRALHFLPLLFVVEEHLAVAEVAALDFSLRGVEE
jgi:hypothetical protein